MRQVSHDKGFAFRLAGFGRANLSGALTDDESVEIMKKNEFLKLLEELLEMDPNTLKGNEILDSLTGWDSLAIVGFIALMDRHFSMEVPAPTVTAAQTIAELIALAGDRIEK